MDRDGFVVPYQAKTKRRKKEQYKEEKKNGTCKCSCVTPVSDVGNEHPRGVSLLVLVLQVNGPPVQRLVVGAALHVRPQLVQPLPRL